MSERLRNRVAAAVLAVSAVVIAAVLVTAPASDADRVAHLAGILKCPVCTSESIASSPSGIARESLALIEERVAEGWTDDEIIDFFVATYGDDMLLDPAGSGRTVALWLLPLLAAAAGVVMILRRQRRQAQPELTDDDRLRVAAARRQREHP
ncbi:MAG: cytochrome c-type biogenesis protein CcmH [Acidimicrobiia bacterium]|nr:cytochrome c-type biogenesis protein CcmH [Acidimicrobiia bacterium]